MTFDEESVEHSSSGKGDRIQPEHSKTQRSTRAQQRAILPYKSGDLTCTQGWFLPGRIVQRVMRERAGVDKLGLEIFGYVYHEVHLREPEPPIATD